jgi:hypothetical protein
MIGFAAFIFFIAMMIITARKRGPRSATWASRGDPDSGAFDVSKAHPDRNVPAREHMTRLPATKPQYSRSGIFSAFYLQKE